MGVWVLGLGIKFLWFCVGILGIGIKFWWFWFEFWASELKFCDFGWNFELRNWILVSLCSIFVILIFKFGFGNQLLHCARILSRDPKIWIQRHRFALQLSWRQKLNPKIKNQNFKFGPETLKSENRLKINRNATPYTNSHQNFTKIWKN